MGEVWAATAPDGVEVAVKLLPEGSLDDATARARFAREVEAAQRVQHPRVQRLLGADPEADRPWLATELVVGPTLGQRVSDDGPLPGPEVRALALGLAEGLAAVHAAGVLHRDLSPANVVLGPDGPVLVDFGIARFAGVTTLTMTGTVVGTAGWLAPELLRDDVAAEAGDVWSLGAVLAFAATGRPPADGSRTEVVLRKVLDGDLDLRGLAPWLDTIVRRCLAADPSARPTAAALVAELDPQGATQPIVVPPTAVAPAAPDAPTAATPAAEPGTRVAWQPWALRFGVLGAGLLLGLFAPPLVLVLTVTVVVVTAMGLKLWAEERAEEKKVPVRPWVLIMGAGLATVTALAEVVGLLLALIAVVGLVVLFLVLGGDLG
jgi:serine/threonine protein kinase